MLILSLKIVLQILKGFGQTGSEAYLPAFFQFLSDSNETCSKCFFCTSGLNETVKSELTLLWGP